MASKHLNTLLILCLVFAISIPASATDLDDGLGLDEPIKDLLEPDTNFSFIVAKAKGRPKQSARVKDKAAGMGNINIGPGANLKGAQIYNLSRVKNGAVVSK